MKLNLQIDNQSFNVFDIAMVVLAVLGVMVGSLGVWLGGVIGWALAVFMAINLLLLAYGVWVEPRRLTITTVKKALSTQPKAWLKAVYIADLHAGPNKPRAWYGKVMAKIKSLEPDVLLIGGDMVVSDTAYLDKLEDLAKIDAPYGKFFILGNHDYLDDPQAVKKQMENWGFTDISHDIKTVTFQGLDWRVAGLDDAFFSRPALPQEAQSEAPLVLMAHEPDVLLDLHEGQANLVLCGHTHGGQVRLPIVGRLAIPSKLKRQVDLGSKVVNGLPVFVTRGLGEVLCRARLLCPPEVVVLELGI